MDPAGPGFDPGLALDPGAADLQLALEAAGPALDSRTPLDGPAARAGDRHVALTLDPLAPGQGSPGDQPGGQDHSLADPRIHRPTSLWLRRLSVNRRRPGLVD